MLDACFGRRAHDVFGAAPLQVWIQAPFEIDVDGLAASQRRVERGLVFDVAGDYLVLSAEPGLGFIQAAGEDAHVVTIGVQPARNWLAQHAGASNYKNRL